MRRILPIIVLLCVSLGLGTYLGMRPDKRLSTGPVLKVFFLNVEGGDSTFIRTPDGKNILIDAGDSEAGPGVVEFLKTHGADRIDLLIISHPRSGHIGGLPDVLEALYVKRVLDVAYPVGSRLQRRVLKQIEDREIPYGRAKSGQKLRVGGLEIDVLSPPKEFLRGTANDTDNNSLVLRMSFGKMKFLFPGDIRTEGEAELIGRGFDLRSNVLKAARHGANNSSSLEFLRMVRPDYVVLSAGEEDPGRRALKRLSQERLGAEVFRTDRNGTIVVKTNGSILLAETER